VDCAQHSYKQVLQCCNKCSLVDKLGVSNTSSTELLEDKKGIPWNPLNPCGSMVLSNITTHSYLYRLRSSKWLWVGGTYTTLYFLVNKHRAKYNGQSLDIYHPNSLQSDHKSVCSDKMS